MTLRFYIDWNALRPRREPQWEDQFEESGRYVSFGTRTRERDEIKVVDGITGLPTDRHGSYRVTDTIATLDGDFTATELRAIAAELDRRGYELLGMKP